MDEKLYEAIIAERKKTPNILNPNAPEFSDGKQTISVANKHLRDFAHGVIDNIPEHKHLRGARILLLVRTSTADAKKLKAGGIIKAGSASKTGSETKLLSGIGSSPQFRADFIVRLSGDWMDLIGATKDGGSEIADTADAEKLGRVIALIDHELCHCDVKTAGEYVKDDEIKTFIEGLSGRYIETCHDIHNKKGATLIRFYHTDKAGRVSFKMRKHDVTEFTGVIGRHGAWDPKLTAMVDVMIEHQPSLFDRPAKKKKEKADAA